MGSLLDCVASCHPTCLLHRGQAHADTARSECFNTPKRKAGARARRLWLQAARQGQLEAIDMLHQQDSVVTACSWLTKAEGDAIIAAPVTADKRSTAAAKIDRCNAERAAWQRRSQQIAAEYRWTRQQKWFQEAEEADRRSRQSDRAEAAAYRAQHPELVEAEKQTQLLEQQRELLQEQNFMLQRALHAL